MSAETLALSRFSRRGTVPACEKRSAAPACLRCFVRRTRSARLLLWNASECNAADAPFWWNGTVLRSFQIHPRASTPDGAKRREGTHALSVFTQPCRRQGGLHRTPPPAGGRGAAPGGIPREAWAIRRTEYRGHARALAKPPPGRAGRSASTRPAGTAPSARRWPAPAPIPRPRWAASPPAAATTFCAPLAQAGVPGPGRPAGRQRRPPRPDGDGPGPSVSVCAAGLDAQVAAGAARFRHNPLFHGEAAYLLSAARRSAGPSGGRCASQWTARPSRPRS